MSSNEAEIYIIFSDKMNFKSFEVVAPELPMASFSFMKNLMAENPYGVSPALLLQALTTSSAADGINLERLETVNLFNKNFL